MSPGWIDDWLVRLEAFYNLGSRVVKFHVAPGTIVMRGLRLDAPQFKPIFREIVGRAYKDGLVGKVPVFPREIEEGIDQYLFVQRALAENPEPAIVVTVPPTENLDVLEVADGV